MRQVFGFSQQAPFGCDLASLLYPEAELDALGWETDQDNAIQRINELHPPAVILVGRTQRPISDLL